MSEVAQVAAGPVTMTVPIIYLAAAVAAFLLLGGGVILIISIYNKAWKGISAAINEALNTRMDTHEKEEKEWREVVGDAHKRLEAELRELRAEVKELRTDVTYLRYRET